MHTVFRRLNASRHSSFYEGKTISVELPTVVREVMTLGFSRETIHPDRSNETN
jgi:hypothetical protein